MIDMEILVLSYAVSGKKKHTHGCRKKDFSCSVTKEEKQRELKLYFDCDPFDNQ